MENGTIKIGYTSDFGRRAKQIATAGGLKISNWCHSEYVLNETAKNIEKQCHSTFSDSRTLGNFSKFLLKTLRTCCMRI